MDDNGATTPDTTPPASSAEQGGNNAPQDDAKSDPKTLTLTLYNETFRRIRLSCTDGGAYVVSPLGKIEIAADERDTIDALSEWERVGAVRISSTQPSDTSWDGFIGIAFWVVGIAFFLAVSNAQDVFPGINQYLAGVIAVMAILAVAVIVWYAIRIGRHRFRLLIVETFTLILTLAIGALLPLFVVDYFGNGSQLRQAGPSLELLGRSLQLVFIIAASLLPALLYFLFDRQRLGTLRARFYRDIFRLDPGLRTLSDVRDKYEKDLEEVYGPDASGSDGRRVAGTRWPIAVATLVITWGWIVTLLPVGRAETIEQPSDLLLLMRPEADPVVFGFIGAYFFALNLIVRRYVRGDLRPKAYGTITVRIFLVVLLAWFFESLIGNTETLLLLAFFAGIVPDTMLVRLQELLRFNALTAERHPLTNLEGIDLYDRARLMDEGVTNIESLAHHDLIDLLLQTRIPAPRLIDWVDQAILYLHLGVDSAASSDASQLQRRLREYGVRSASDLEDIVCGPDASEQADDCLISLTDTDRHPSRLRVILRALADEEWMAYIRHWRDSAFIEEQVITSPEALYAPSRPAPPPRSTMPRYMAPEDKHRFTDILTLAAPSAGTTGDSVPTRVSDGNGHKDQ